MKIWFDPKGEEYHASPRCPQVGSRRRLQLRMIKDRAPDGQYPCGACCPVEVHYCERLAQRPPIFFHLDEDCDLLTQELMPEQGNGWERGWGRLNWAAWPSRRHDDIVRNRHDIWKRCPKCVPYMDLLYPLGSTERPTYVRRSDAA